MAALACKTANIQISLQFLKFTVLPAPVRGHQQMVLMCYTADQQLCRSHFPQQIHKQLWSLWDDLFTGPHR